MNGRLVTVVSATVEPDRQQELMEGFRGLLAAPVPDGLLHTQLLQGANRTWCIQSLWRDREALEKMRAGAEPPAAPRLFRALGAEPSLQIFEIKVEASFTLQ
jgi:quinol monooxygenase YgiN